MFIQKLTDTLTACVAYVDRNRWLFPLLLVLITGIHFSTLTISPTYWQDEMQIIEHGRVMLNPNTEYSMNWSIEDDRPINTEPFYLLKVIQESIFIHFDYSVAATRSAVLFGALAAAFAVYAFFRNYGFSFLLAASLAVMFLSDPLLVQSFKGGRVDVYLMGVFFSSLTCFVIAIREKSKISYYHMAISGFMLGVTPLMWPSAILLYPLFAYVIYMCFDLKVSYRIQKNMILLGVFIISVLTSFLVFFHAAYDSIWGTLTEFVEEMNLVRNNNKQIMLNWSQFEATLVIFFKSPFLLLIGITGILVSRSWVLLGCFLITWFMCVITGIYVHRLIYLIPYLLLGAGLLIQQLSAPYFTQFVVLRRYLIAPALTWAVAVSCFARPFVAYSSIDSRNYAQMDDNPVSEKISKTDAVFLEPRELYPMARKNQWEIYRPYHDTKYSKHFRSYAMQKFSARLDWLLLKEKSLYRDLLKIHQYQEVPLNVESEKWKSYRLYRKIR